ncbi:MAG: hypothetical protein KKE17_09295 [Proteobacteria bacterium]|nr:hypothetical protein [Pseudomonadota bacterium]MBU1710184.1 hypothetical protein [Pseudomonadota bacterium]
MQLFSKPVNMKKVRTVIYHLPDGEALVMKVDGVVDDMKFGLGKICDTSEIDGIIHFYPRGYA